MYKPPPSLRFNLFQDSHSNRHTLSCLPVSRRDELLTSAHSTLTVLRAARTYAIHTATTRDIAIETLLARYKKLPRVYYTYHKPKLETLGATAYRLFPDRAKECGVGVILKRLTPSELTYVKSENKKAREVVMPTYRAFRALIKKEEETILEEISPRVQRLDLSNDIHVLKKKIEILKKWIPYIPKTDGSPFICFYSETKDRTGWFSLPDSKKEHYRILAQKEYLRKSAQAEEALKGTSFRDACLEFLLGKYRRHLADLTGKTAKTQSMIYKYHHPRIVISGYTLFLQEKSGKGIRFSDVAKQWRELSQEEKKEWSEMYKKSAGSDRQILFSFLKRRDTTIQEIETELSKALSSVVSVA